MSYRRVKSVGYDDDDFDYDDEPEAEYEGGQEEVSPEDKEQLRLGTIEVKKLLGTTYLISDSEIQDALWNYYYDLDKTTNYLKNKHKPKAAPAKSTQRTPASTKAPHKTAPKAPHKAQAVTNGLQQMTIEKPKSKNVDVLSEYKKVKQKNAANFVVIGHVDAGKSTLMGRLLFDLEAINKRTMDKYKQEAERIGKGSFAFAWVMDSGTEERERGVTIDIATNTFETDKTNFTILDAPGHKDFVPNMIAGASQADLAVLVIDASPGSFESGLKGQTKEHALLAKSTGVQRMIVAVNKMDSVQWSQARFEDIKSQMSTFLKATRFNLESTAFIPCSGLKGENILKPVTDPNASWYSSNGQTLVQALDAYEPVSHNLERPLRMTIADVFRGASVQHPLSISGRIEAGTLQVGDEILIQPSGEKAYIKALDLEHDDGEYIREWAVAGQNVVLHLTDIEEIHLRPGDVICHPSSPIATVKSFTASILTFEHITPMFVEIHRGRLHVPGRIDKMVAILDKKTGEVIKKRPRMIQPEEAARVVVEIESDKRVPLEAGARIVLRSQGQTVGAGLVEE